MIQVASQKYFLDIQEVRKLNKFMEKNPEVTDTFGEYIKENFNATYKTSAWPTVGYFEFENERDAIMFMLKWP